MVKKSFTVNNPAESYLTGEPEKKDRHISRMDREKEKHDESITEELKNAIQRNIEQGEKRDRKINFLFPPSLADRLLNYSKAHRVSMNQIVIDALKIYLQVAEENNQ